MDAQSQEHRKYRFSVCQQQQNQATEHAQNGTIVMKNYGIA